MSSPDRGSFVRKSAIKEGLPLEERIREMDDNKSDKSEEDCKDGK